MSEILTEVERDAIRAVARTNLAAAREAFERAVPRHGVDSCVELQFMAEVLAPVPDLMLRSQYRAAVLKQS
ncbi:hypothetical protein WL37_06130 [Burkholderia ubonensis]|uniref:hypothetical protein n=1 Tax=Burkholderia ubonensis TaxID=101571 RepID=UPI0007541213|nr:hypothetical protein [Burkholderia ubonensis]KWB52717.1 hypothetical protein WL37_06130 [Burkholderia ubonensis]